MDRQKVVLIVALVVILVAIGFIGATLFERSDGLFVEPVRVEDSSSARVSIEVVPDGEVHDALE